MKALFLLLFVLNFSSAQAGDASVFTSLGFSSDGRYYAYTEDGIHDGSGAYWIELGIIDVLKNEYVGRSFLGGDTEEGVTDENESEELLAELKAKLSFSKYGFAQTAREEVIVSRPQTDLSSYVSTRFATDYWAGGGASPIVPAYELILNEKPAPLTKHNDWCGDWVGNSMIELKLKHPSFNDDDTAKVEILQNDNEQPRVRACSYDYAIRYVFTHKEKIAVVISYRGPGFEGPNERYMVVTGKL